MKSLQCWSSPPVITIPGLYTCIATMLSFQCRPTWDVTAGPSNLPSLLWRVPVDRDFAKFVGQPLIRASFTTPTSFQIWLACQPRRTKGINSSSPSDLPLSSLVPLPCPSCRMSGDPGVLSLPHSLLTYLLLLQVLGTRYSVVACRCVPVEGPLRVVEFEATRSCQVRRSP